MYTPGRDERFHYMWDLMSFIEEEQCLSCRFRKDPNDFAEKYAEDYPMCGEVEGKIIAEDGPVEELDDHGDEGVVCTKYLPGDPKDFVVDPLQMELF